MARLPLSIADITKANAERWARMKILPRRELEVERVAMRLCGRRAKGIYQQISQQVWGKPDRWWFVAIVHERECSQNFWRSIAQGDPWYQVSKHVPKGIGPFRGFVEAAVYTLNRVAPYPGRWKDWSIGGVLTLFELYNGLGYEEYHHEASPYDWGATDIEQQGKYTADNHFNPKVWDLQVGAAAMLHEMMEIDRSIVIG